MSPRRAAPRLALLLAVACAGPTRAEPPRRPHIVLLVADDQGWGETGGRGHPHLRTPALDRLAAEGLSLERFHAAAPVCSPTRSSLLTGRHPVRTTTFAWGHDLPPDEVTLAERLGEAGYATAHLGKWHLGSLRAGEDTTPGAQGFEHWVSSPNFFDLDPLLSDGGTVLETHGEGSAVLVDLALAWLDDRAAAGDERPLFLTVWFASPHDPHVAAPDAAPPAPGMPPALAAYVAELEALDAAVGRLREGLASRGLGDHTLLWFTSDNGPRPPALRQASTGGLRGAKGGLWEGGLRVPSLVAWPGVVAAGRRSEVLSGSVDVAPTLLAAAGLDPAGPAAGPLDGVSLLGVLRGADAPTDPPRALGFWTLPVGGQAKHADALLAAQRDGRRHPDEAVPRGVAEAVLGDGARPGHAAWIEGRFKLHRLPDNDGAPPRLELYDLDADPAEQRDLAAERPDLTARLAADLAAWMEAAARDALDG